MLRLTTALFLCTALPAMAWEATLGAICTLEHETPTAKIRLTHDPAAPLYTISITRKTGPWPEAATFSMAFTGAAALRIGTDRHVLSQDRRTLTVTDRGFGNVLNGLQFNAIARANAGTATEDIPLDGAAPAVQAFRDCPPFTGA